MAELDVNIARLGESRTWLQRAATPAQAYAYQGCVNFGEAEQDQGAAEPIYCPSSEQRNKWVIVDVAPQAQALGSRDFTAQMDRFGQDVFWALKQQGCFFNLLDLWGRCSRPDNFNQWEMGILYLYARLTTFTAPQSNPLEGDNNAAAQITGSLEFRESTVIRSLKWAEQADSVIVAEALDGFYNDTPDCGDCGASSDGCSKRYILTAASGGSPGLSSRLVVTTDDGASYSSLDISVLGGLSANRMAAVGSYVVIVSQANGGHVYATFTSVDAGAPSWTLVTSGYVSTKGPRAIHSRNSNATYIAAAGGYIYFLASPTSLPTVLTDGSVTTQDLNDIHGIGATIVAVGNSNAVLYSANGQTFSSITGPAVGVNLTSIACISSQIWEVGTGDGRLFYTLNAGTSWTQTNLPVSLSVVNDIRFYGGTVGYLAGESAGVGVLLSTLDSGNSWQVGAASPRLNLTPTAQRYNFVFPCGYNEVLAGGRKTVGGDGIITLAS